MLSNKYINFTIFWASFSIGLSICLFLLDHLAYVSSSYALVVIGELIAGNIERLSDLVFVFTLAAWIASVGFGFLCSYLVQYGILVPRQIKAVRRLVLSGRDRRGFTQEYNDISAKLSLHPIIGSAWREFDETLVKPDADGSSDVIENTVRPSSFLNIELLRGRSFALKMMPSIPGYFVGVGLLLTFIGLVLALDKAGRAVSADDVKVMQTATRELLSVASFKFATSIAGLATSIVLGIAFRSISIRIENVFSALCEDVETMLLYRSPQSISVEMAERLREQRDYLRDITQGDFFQRFGNEFGPRLQTAVSNSMAPVITSIQSAVSELSNKSQDGTEELLREFSNSLHKGAGNEMKEFAAAIREMQTSLSSMQGAMNRTSESFGANMREASDRLNGALGVAAEGAGERLDAAMNGVVGNLEENFTSLAAVITSAKDAIAEQSSAQNNASSNMQSVADAFAKTAANIAAASDPLLQSSNRISGSVQAMEVAIKESVRALETEKSAAASLSVTLATKVSKLETLWSGYANRFERIDEELGKALNALSEATTEQAQRLKEYTDSVDSGLAGAVDKLQNLLGGLSENTQDFADSVDELTKTLVTKDDQEG